MAARKPTKDQLMLDATLKMRVCAKVLHELGQENLDPRGGVTKLREELRTIASVVGASTKQASQASGIEYCLSSSFVDKGFSGSNTRQLSKELKAWESEGSQKKVQKTHSACVPVPTVSASLRQPAAIRSFYHAGHFKVGKVSVVMPANMTEYTPLEAISLLLDLKDRGIVSLEQGCSVTQVMHILRHYFLNALPAMELLSQK